MSIKGIRKVCGAFVVAMAISACATAAPSARVYVRVGPPRAVAEVRTASPGRGYVWIGGYHRWDGGAYAWVPGRWELPPRARAHWVAGHWTREGRRGWYFVEGHWR